MHNNAGGPRIQFFARPLTAVSQLQTISEVLSAADIVGRGKIMLAAINICRWAATLCRDQVLPPILHPLGVTMHRPSPFGELLHVDDQFVKVTISPRFVCTSRCRYLQSLLGGLEGLTCCFVYL